MLFHCVLDQPNCFIVKKLDFMMKFKEAVIEHVMQWLNVQ